MYLYKVGYYSEEDNEYTELSFDKKLTNEELEEYVNRATVSALEYMVENEEVILLIKGGPAFEDLYNLVIEKLNGMGFKKVEYEAKWNCFGWASVCTNDWKDHSSVENKRLREAIPEDLRNRVLEISKRRSR